MANDQLLDPAIAAAADLASIINATDAAAADLVHLIIAADPMWLASLVMSAAVAGLTLGQALGSQLQGRLFTGYRPEDQRRATRHLSRSNGLPVVS